MCLWQVRLGLEDLFYEAGVDVELWAHEHEYERLFPIYNFTVCNGSAEYPYTNPRAPVHITSGSAVSFYLLLSLTACHCASPVLSTAMQLNRRGNVSVELLACR